MHHTTHEYMIRRINPRKEREKSMSTIYSPRQDDDKRDLIIQLFLDAIKVHGESGGKRRESGFETIAIQARRAYKGSTKCGVIKIR